MATLDEKIQKAEKKIRDRMKGISTERTDYPGTMTEWAYFSAAVRDVNHLLNDREGLIALRSEEH